MGRDVVLAKPPQTVVSLVPSDTYTMSRLGALDRIVGCTDFCSDFGTDLSEGRPGTDTIVRIGGTKNVAIEKVCDLRPDLVVANQEENTKKKVEALIAAGLRVYVGFPKTVAQSLAHVARLAKVLGLARSPQAKALVATGYERYNDLRAKRMLSANRGEVSVDICRTVLVPIWWKPLMAVGAETYASSLLRFFGWQSIFDFDVRSGAGLGGPSDSDTRAIEERESISIGRKRSRFDWHGNKVIEPGMRYPKVSVQQIADRDPDLILLPNEPFAFTERHRQEIIGWNVSAAKHKKVYLVDGKPLFWHGAATSDALDPAGPLARILCGQ